MRLRSWLGLLVGAGLISMAAWWLSTAPDPGAPPRAAPLVLAWDALEPVSYDLRVESLAHGPVGADARRAVLEGVLTLVVAPGEDDTAAPPSRVRLAAQLHDVRQVPAAPSEGLSRPFEVLVAPDGTIEGLEFAAAVPVEVQGRLEELVRVFQFVLPAGAGEAWEVRESHTLGAYRARYERDGASLRKHKLAYLDEAAGGDGLEAIGRMRVVASSAEAGLSDRFWLEHATVAESIELSMEETVAFRFDVWASLARRPRGPSAFPVVAPPADIAGLAAVATPPRERAALVAPPPDDSRERFEAALAALRQVDGRSVSDYVALKTALRDDPALSERVLDLLTGGELSDPLEATLVLALERAGHARAQAALVALAEDPARSFLLRLRAVVALGGVDEPDEALPPALWRIVQQRPAATELADTAALALGSAARRLRGLDPARYEVLRGELYAALANARLDGERTALLMAMGNTADAHFADYVAWWMEAGTTLVRASAASALGYMDDPDADRDQALGLLVTALPRESEPRVREAIARSLVRLGRSDPEAIRIVSAELARETTPEAGYRMATYLLERLPEHPEVRPVLEDTLARTTSRRLRDLLLRSL